jgi:hypothetical protein
MSANKSAELPTFTFEQLEENLAKLLVDGPLYKKLRYRGTLNSVLPFKLSMVCEICESRSQNWNSVSRFRPVNTPYSSPPPSQYTSIPSNLTARGSFNFEQYKCRNCERSVVTYVYYWWASSREPGKVADFEFAKVGQFPPPQANVTPVLAKKLSKREKEFYRKALTSRNNSYGLGSLVYLRRIVEDRMNALLDLLIEAADKDSSLETFKAEVADVKEKGSFDDKIAYASKLLPSRLKPGGINPIDHLHDLASEGIHRLSDEECLDIFDKCRSGFEFVFEELEVQIEHAKAYVKEVQKLAEKP